MIKQYKTIIKKIFPISKPEAAKFFCVATLGLFIACVHGILHIAKDVLIISHLGTESISALKIWATLPVSLLFMLLYMKLSDKFNRAKLFHVTTWFFITYFALFAVVLYPHREVLSIDTSFIAAKLPSLKYLFNIISNWHYSLFYIFAEGWVAMMLLISFWQTANHVTTNTESKRFYPLFGFFMGIGKLIACLLSINSISTNSDWQPTINSITITVIMSGIAISLCIFTLQIIIGKDKFNHKNSHFKHKKKISIKESLKYITSSKIILFVAGLLFCYNTALNLVEGVWKKSIEVFFHKNPNQIQFFISHVDICIAIMSMLATYVGIYLLRNFKWKTAALVMPMAVLITGGIFFIFISLNNIVNFPIIRTYSLVIGVYLGAIYNVFSRSLKQTVFDPTKEMVYIPLDDDLQIKGKAAAETIGLRLGKGSGSFIQQVLFAIFPAMSLLEISPIIFGVFLIVMFFWFYSTVSLSKEHAKNK